MTLTKGTFVELDYTAMIADDHIVFDTTIEEIAKKEQLTTHKKFGPVIICLGAHHLLPGLDNQLIGKDLGKHKVLVPTEEAFGKKSAKLLQLIPKKKFADQNINPMPGMEITVDNQSGIVRTVSGGRIIVDFNHPLAGRDLEYDVTIKRTVENPKEQIETLFSLRNIPKVEVVINEDKATITTSQMFPQELQDYFTKEITKLTIIKEVLFTAKTTTKSEIKNNKV